MPRIGPVILTTVGDTYVDSCRVGMIIWEGTTAAGDTVEVQADGFILWPGRTSQTQTYLGMSFPDPGLHCPHGFNLTRLDNGKVYVYLTER